MAEKFPDSQGTKEVNFPKSQQEKLAFYEQSISDLINKKKLAQISSMAHDDQDIIFYPDTNYKDKTLTISSF